MAIDLEIFPLNNPLNLWVSPEMGLWNGALAREMVNEAPVVMLLPKQIDR